MNLPSSSAVVHVREACDIAVIARVTTLIFTIDICDSFGHACEKVSKGQILGDK